MLVGFDYRSKVLAMSLLKSADLYLLQEKVALHEAVAEESSRGSTVLEKAGGVRPSPGVSPHQLTVMRD